MILQKLKTMLENSTHATCRYHANKKDSQDPGFLKLKVESTGHEHGNDDWFELRFLLKDDALQLHLFDSHYRRKSSADNAVVHNEQQLLAFILAVQDYQDRRNIRIKRNEKTTSFQQHGLTARLRMLSEEHGFSFAIGQNRRDILLSIRIGNRKTGFHFSFPKGKLNAVIDQIPNLICSLSALTKLSVSFRTDNRKWDGKQSAWYIPSGSRNTDSTRLTEEETE